MSRLLGRLQESTLALAGLGRETVRVAPFTAFVDHRRTLRFFSFAVPDPGSGPEASAALEALAAAFAERGRAGRIELIEELAPEMPGVLERSGWSRSERVPVMACTPGSLVVPVTPRDIEVIAPDAASPEHVVEGWHRTVGIAFGDESDIEEAEVQVWRDRAPTSFYAAALSAGEVVGTAAASPISLGASEVGAVATLPEHRRRGIAGVLTARVAAAAFGAGAEIVWLTSAREAAALYARAGFSVVGTAAHYDAPG